MLTISTIRTMYKQHLDQANPFFGQQMSTKMMERTFSSWSVIGGERNLQLLALYNRYYELVLELECLSINF